MNHTDHPHRPHHHHTHLSEQPLEAISKYAPFAGLILSAILCVLFILKQYILEPLAPKFYKCYAGLQPVAQKGFINHHVAGMLRIIIFSIGAYPFLAVAFGRSILSSPVVTGGKTTMGDLLLIASQLLVAMYLFELIYRIKVSPVACLHHLGTVLVAQSAVAISIYYQRDSDYEFILCCVWGAFDVIGELLPNFAIPLYRIRPNDHDYLYKFFLITAITTFMSTIAETVLTMYLFGTLWERWDLSFKLATPLLHCAFSAAQLHGSRIFLGMAMRERKRLREEGQKTDKSSDKHPNV